MKNFNNKNPNIKILIQCSTSDIMIKFNNVKNWKIKLINGRTDIRHYKRVKIKNQKISNWQWSAKENLLSIDKLGS